MTRLRYAEAFVQDVAEAVRSETKRNEIKAVCFLLADFPELGPHATMLSFTQRYGDTVRRLSCKPFVIAYEYLPAIDEVRVLGLMHEKQVY